MRRALGQRSAHGLAGLAGCCDQGFVGLQHLTHLGQRLCVGPGDLLGLAVLDALGMTAVIPSGVPEGPTHSAANGNEGGARDEDERGFHGHAPWPQPAAS